MLVLKGNNSCKKYNFRIKVGFEHLGVKPVIQPIRAKNICFRVLFGCNSTFEHPAYLNSGKKIMWKHIFIEFCTIRNSKT